MALDPVIEIARRRKEIAGMGMYKGEKYVFSKGTRDRPILKEPYSDVVSNLK